MSHQLPPLPEQTCLGGDPDFNDAVYGHTDSALTAYADLAIADKDAEILRLHVKLAGETLRADQGWERYEHANKSRLHLESIASVKREPLSDDRIDQVQSACYLELASQGFSGGMGGLTWDRAAARAIEQAHGITTTSPALRQLIEEGQEEDGDGKGDGK